MSTPVSGNIVKIAHSVYLTLENNPQVITQHSELDSLVQFGALSSQNTTSGVRLSPRGCMGDNEGRLDKTASSIKICRTQRPEVHGKEA